MAKTKKVVKKTTKKAVKVAKATKKAVKKVVEAPPEPVQDFDHVEVPDLEDNEEGDEAEDL